MCAAIIEYHFLYNFRNFCCVMAIGRGRGNMIETTNVHSSMVYQWPRDTIQSSKRMTEEAINRPGVSAKHWQMHHKQCSSNVQYLQYPNSTSYTHTPFRIKSLLKLVSEYWWVKLNIVQTIYNEVSSVVFIANICTQKWCQGDFIILTLNACIPIVFCVCMC